VQVRQEIEPETRKDEKSTPAPLDQPKVQPFFEQPYAGIEVKVPRHTKQPKPNKSEPKPELSIPRLTLIWTRCLEYVKNKNFEEAYRVMLEYGDDMYLLRLVAQTRPVV